MKHIRRYFISGLVILAPLFLTLLFIRYLFRLTDAFIVDPVFQLLPGNVDLASRILITKIVIALAVVTLVTLLGVAAEKFIFRRLIETGEAVLLNIPVFNRIYRSLKDISQALLGNKSGIFKRVVFLEYPRLGVYTMGFVTLEDSWWLSEKTGKSLVSIFLPNPPNPTTGLFVFVPKEDLIDSDMSVEEGIRLTISVGAAVPPRRN